LTTNEAGNLDEIKRSSIPSSKSKIKVGKSQIGFHPKEHRYAVGPGASQSHR
jgi:hypothetical protein